MVMVGTERIAMMGQIGILVMVRLSVGAVVGCCGPIGIVMILV